MSTLEKEQFSPPVAYEEWLNCFDLLKESSAVDQRVVMTIAQGSFISDGYIAVRFRQKLVETVNEMLNKRTARFLKDLNTLISFNEFADMAPLFVKLRNEVNKCLFFTEWGFLGEEMKGELARSVKGQMRKFWEDTVAFLQKQTVEFCNADLEDALFLIRRLELFPPAMR